MPTVPQRVPRRTPREWSFTSQHPYANPFGDVVFDGNFISPSGRTITIPGFYDGAQTWRLRFSPDEVGTWTFRTIVRPHNPDLTQQGSFEVTPNDGQVGFLKATPGQAWGFHFESGDPVFIFGDTVYELFGMAHCGADVTSFLQRRKQQGFNLLRIRVPTSAYVSVGEPPVPPEDFKGWHNRSTWPWGGAEQFPRFDHFNLDYFRTVDAVISLAEEVGIGIEMIMEAWGNEFPFNNRLVFLPEWEELWMRYLIARYDAYNCVYIWTLLNEYEYYPNGDWHYKPVSDRWAIRMGRWVKGVAQHGHVIAVHNGPREPAFAQRLALDPEAVDAVMFQEWGTRDEALGWLAAGIEEQIENSFAGWRGSSIFSEWGYERNPQMPNLAPHHAFCDPEHTRRGAWRGAFCAQGIIHGFENSWGIFPLQADDQHPGMDYLLLVRKFFTEVVPFHHLRVASQVISEGNDAVGHRPRVLASEAQDVVAVYLPTGGRVTLRLTQSEYRAQWFDPRTGALTEATPQGDTAAGLSFTAPVGGGAQPWDWALVLRAVQRAM
jgi:hypothetical protein